jgi:alpha-tubulin suppressor-like RCC1 family protein
VSGLASGVTALAAGLEHTCALTTGGGVKCWGRNDAGQLGDGTTINRSTPVDVSGLASGVTALAAGGNHNCAVMDAIHGGGVKCWGGNGSGQLGDGTSGNPRLTPVDVIGLASGVTALAAGFGHTCAVNTGGGVKCWGANGGGQLGDGTTTQRITPVDVIGLASGATNLAAGGGESSDGGHTCAVTTGGGVRCWGANGVGQLGDGTSGWENNRLTPVEVSGLASGVTALVAGEYHTCALAHQRLKCWGADGTGQLGQGTLLPLLRLTPVDVVAAAARVRLGYATGQPGSTFTLTGENFPAGAQATVSVNGATVATNLPINAMGQFIAFLSTAAAGPGYYVVRVTAGVTAMNAFVLDAAWPLRPQEGGGMTFAVLAGIGAAYKTLYLPVMLRQTGR